MFGKQKKTDLRKELVFKKSETSRSGSDHTWELTVVYHPDRKSLQTKSLEQDGEA